MSDNSSHNNNELLSDGEEEESVGGIFAALDDDDASEDEAPPPPPSAPAVVKETTNKNKNELNASNHKVYRVPVNLFKDEATGEQYFYLQKGTFPNRSITDLKIIYTHQEKDQVREQVLANTTCPEVVLKNVRVECCLGGNKSNEDENDNHKHDADDDDDDYDYLNDESFRLSGSKIAAIRMRMYAKQKLQAQKQMEDPNCHKIILHLDIECRLGRREPSQ